MLRILAESVRTELRQVGFPVEKRVFVPHITLCRLGPRDGGEKLKGAVERLPPGPVGGVSDMVLMQSLLGAGGSEYRPIAREPLGQK